MKSFLDLALDQVYHQVPIAVASGMAIIFSISSFIRMEFIIPFDLNWVVMPYC